MEIASFPSYSSQKLRAWGVKAQEMRGLATPGSQSRGVGRSSELQRSEETWVSPGVGSASIPLPPSTPAFLGPGSRLTRPVPMTPAPRASEEERRAAPASVWMVPWAGCSPAGALSRSLVPAGQSPIEGLCCRQQGSCEGGRAQPVGLTKQAQPDGLGSAAGVKYAHYVEHRAWGSSSGCWDLGEVLRPSSPWGQRDQYQLIVREGPAWSWPHTVTPINVRSSIGHAPTALLSGPQNETLSENAPLF